MTSRPSSAPPAIQSSADAVAMGVPVAVDGRGPRAPRRAPHGAPGAPQAALLPGFGGVLFSAYLTWEEVAVIGATYQWCAVSAVLVAVLLAAEGAQAAETRRPGEG